MRASVAVLFALVVGSVTPSTGQPITRLRSNATVPSREFATIQAAIDAVDDGGSIFVKSGTYREQLTIDGKRIRLRGSAADGPRRTEIVGADSSEVDDHTRAVGLVNYLNGGGGVIESIELRGGLNGIVGNGTAVLRDEVAPGLSNALTVRDVVIRDSGRGILWHAPANLTLHGVRARGLRHNGIVFAPLSGESRLSARLNFVNVDIFQAGSYGLLVDDPDSTGCENQLSNVNVTLASLGGIGVIRSAVCISGGLLSLNRISGIYLEQSTALIDGTSVQSSLATGAGSWGDGIVSMGSDVTLSNAFLNLNARAALSNFGGLATLSWNTLNCNAFDLDGEKLLAGFFGPSQPPADVPYKFDDQPPGSNTCGCGAVLHACQAQSSALVPPVPVVAP